MSIVYSRMNNKASQIDSLNECLMLNPKYVKALVKRAEIHMENKRYGEAVRDYTKIKSINPSEKDIDKKLLTAQFEANCEVDTS